MSFGPNMHMQPMVAAEAIKASVVVKTYGAGVDRGVKKCGVNPAIDVPFGIAQNWNEGTPGTPFDTGFAASTGKTIMVWGPASTAVAAVQNQGTPIAAGVLVGPDVDGEIVPVTSGWSVGYVMEAGSNTKRWRLRVYVHPVRITTGSTS